MTQAISVSERPHCHCKREGERATVHAGVRTFPSQIDWGCTGYNV